MGENLEALMPNPLVTIGIPTRNRQDFLMQALASARNQDYPNLEIIVADNESSDGTGERVLSIQDSRVRYLRSDSNIGMVPNFRRIIEHARGEYVVLLSDDDTLRPTFTAWGVAALEGNPAAQFAFSSVGFFGEKSGDIVWALPERIAGDAYVEFSLRRAENLTHLCGAIARRVEIEKIGLTDQTFFDWPLWLSLAQKGEVIHTRTVLADYRTHPSNETLGLAADPIAHLASLQQAILEFSRHNSLDRQEQLLVQGCLDLLFERYLGNLSASSNVGWLPFVKSLAKAATLPAKPTKKIKTILRAITKQALSSVISPH